MNISDGVLREFLRPVIKSAAWKTISEKGTLACASHGLASCVILQALGLEWSERHIGRTDKTCDYLKARRTEHEELARFMSRVTEFGELIYNLHRVAGFDERILAIKNDEKIGLESGISELYAGKFFKLANVPFQFVVQKTEPGKTTPRNPDIEYVAGFNRWEFCEVKCNLEKTGLSEDSIINSLKTAKNQLPKGKAGCIMLRVPENSTSDMNQAIPVIENAVSRFFNREKSTRVSSVFVFVSETRFLPNQKMAQTLPIKEFRNHYCDKGAGIVLPDQTSCARNWRSLQDLARTILSLETQRSILVPTQGIWRVG